MHYSLQPGRMQCLLCLNRIQCLLAEGIWGIFPIGWKCPKSAAATGEAAWSLFGTFSQDFELGHFFRNRTVEALHAESAQRKDV